MNTWLSVLACSIGFSGLLAALVALATSSGLLHDGTQVTIRGAAKALAARDLARFEQLVDLHGLVETATPKKDADVAVWRRVNGLAPVRDHARQRTVEELVAALRRFVATGQAPPGLPDAVRDGGSMFSLLDSLERTFSPADSEPFVYRGYGDPSFSVQIGVSTNQKLAVTLYLSQASGDWQIARIDYWIWKDIGRFAHFKRRR